MHKYIIYIWLLLSCFILLPRASAGQHLQTTDSLKQLPKTNLMQYADKCETTADSLFTIKEIKSAEAYYNTAYRIYFSANSLFKAGRVLLRLAALYQQADIPKKAEESIKQANTIFMALDDASYEYQSLWLLAEFEYESKDWKKFDKYAQLVENRAKQINDSVSLAKMYWLKGERFRKKSANKAKKLFKKALATLPKAKGTELKADVCSSLGSVHLDNHEIEDAIRCLNQSLSHYKAVDALKKEAHVTYLLGLATKKKKQLQFAEEHFMKTYSIASSFQYFNLASLSAKELSLIFETQKDFLKASLYYTHSLNYSDSCYFQEVKKSHQLLKDRYEIKRRDKILRIQQADISLKEQQNKEWNIRVIFLGIMLFAILAVIVFLYYKSNQRYLDNELIGKQNKEIAAYNDKIVQQKEELEVQNACLIESKEEILVQRNMLEVQNGYLNSHREHIKQQRENLLQNLQFAQKLQNSMMPPKRKMKALLRDYFLISYPQNVVSGDFHWIKRLDSNRQIVVVADSTGHGVPGALMSVLGIAYLNELVSEKPVVTAAEVLEKLRKRVKTALRSSSGDMQKDGFDVAVCIIERSTNRLQYAGALSPLYLVRDGHLEMFKADRFPVGSYVAFDKPFSNHEFTAQTGDMIYMFSDGLKDQFGGEKGKKFSSKRLRELFLEIAHESTDIQSEIIKKRFKDWRGDNEQTDDLILLGVRL